MPITVGTVEVEVVPTTRGIRRRLQQDLLPAAAQVGQEAGREMGDRMAAALRQQVASSGSSIGQQLGQQIASRMQSEIRGALRSAVTQGGRQAQAQASRSGGDVGGAFARSMRTRIEAAIRSLPDITIGANTTEAEADIQALRARLETLSGRRIGIDIDAAQALAEAEQIDEELRRIGASHPNVQIRTDTSAARAALAEFRAELERLNRTSASPRVEVDGGFAQRLRASVQAAQAQLPDINIGANTSAASAELQSLRGQLEALRNVRVGIDIDAAAATARISEIQARLEALAVSDATVDVRVDAAAAATQLAAVQAQVNALDGDTARVDIDVSSAAAGLLRLTTLAAGLGPALVPALGAATFGLGAFTSMLTASAAGVGLFAAAAAPSLMGVGKALQATTAANEALATAQDKSARSGVQQAIQAQQQALTMAGAQQSLASARRSAAQAVEDAQGRVAAAARQVTDAQDRVAEASLRVVDAQKKVGDAERAVADAREQAGLRMDAALDRITDAERSRTDAVRDAKRAEDALTDARRAAQEQLEDLNARVAGGAISERRAVLAVQRAQQELDKVRQSGANADALAAQEAQLSYDEAVQRLQDLQRENRRTAVEAAAANKAGVDGSREVRDAQQGIVDAHSRARDAAESVAEAQAEAARTQIEGARAVAKAEEGVVDAQRDVVRARAQVADAEQGVVQARAQVVEAERAVARARQQGAEAVASAQRQIASAQLSAAAAAAQQAGGADAAASALDKQKRALDALSPAQRSVYDAVQRLKDGFKAWGDSLAPATMPLVTRALDALTRMLPGLTPLVLAAADGLNRLGDRARGAFEDPFWDRFKANLITNLPRAIESMGVVFGNVFAGLAGIVNAFLPRTDAIATSMEGATASFRKWGQGLDQADSFRNFTDYVSRTWPGIREMFADVGGALWQLTQALSNVSPAAVLIIQGIATAIDNTPVWVLQALIDAFLAYKIAVFAVAAAQAVYAGAMTLYATVTALATTATWSFSAALRAVSSANFIVFLLTIIGTFTLLMIQSEGFRNKVIGVFREVGSWGVWLWENALRPAFQGIATAAVWLWENAIRPSFDAISLAARILAAVVAVVLLVPLLIGFQLLATAATFLWQVAIKPLFDNVAAGAAWLWDSGIRPWFGLIWDGMQFLGDKAEWLYDSMIRPMFTAIGTTIRWVHDAWIKPAIDLATGTFDTLGRWAQTLHDDWIKPWFDKIAGVVQGVADGFKTAFDTAKTGIAEVWNGIKGVVAEPINWVIDKVYTGGIKKVWDAIAGKVGLPALPDAGRIDGYATGGIYPGYTPGRDVGLIGVSGGEAIIRPEGTRALGTGWVHGLNAASRAGGVSGAQSFLAGQRAPYLGGFDLGGIVGDIGGGIADFAGDIKEAAEDIVRGAAAKVVEGMLAPVRAMVNLAPDRPDWMLAAKRMPLSLMDGLIAKIKDEDAKAASGTVGGALEWAKTQAGKPYQWGGSGNPSWDCSGLMAAIQQVILGQEPRRLWTTFDFAGGQAPAGWQKDLQAPFMIGISNIGPGHTAGTLLGTNVESRGGDGVIVGPAARGWNHPMFYNHYGFKPSLAATAAAAPTGQLAEWIGQALSATDTPPPGSLLRWLVGMSTLVNRESGGNPLAINTTDSNARAGNASRGLAQVIPTTFAAYHQPGTSSDIFDPVANLSASINYIKSRYGNITNVQQANPDLPPKGYRLGGVVPFTYDSGGYLPPGLNLTYNGTGRPEPVLTARQEAALSGALRGGGGGQFTGNLFLDSGQFLGAVNGQIDRKQAAVAGRLDAGPRT